MGRKRERKISSWEELCEFVEGTNTFKKTIVMTGYINQIDGDKLRVRDVFFATADTEILKKTKPKSKRK